MNPWKLWSMRKDYKTESKNIQVDHEKGIISLLMPNKEIMSLTMNNTRIPINVQETKIVPKKKYTKRKNVIVLPIEDNWHYGLKNPGKNQYRLDDSKEFAVVKLTQDYEMKIDINDLEILKYHIFSAWKLQGYVYAVTMLNNKLHTFISIIYKDNKAKRIEYKNGNSLDYRRSNIINRTMRIVNDPIIIEKKKSYREMQDFDSKTWLPGLKNPSKNQYSIDTEANVIYVKLSKDQITMISIEDMYILKEHTLCSSQYTRPNGKSGYYVITRDDNSNVCSLHRIVTKSIDSGLYVDHINRDTLDNTRDNLRLCTQSENLRNASLSSRNKTGMRGVSTINDTSYYAHICGPNGKEKSQRWNINDYHDAKERAIEWRLQKEKEYGYLPQ